MMRLILYSGFIFGLGACSSLLYFPSQGQYYDPAKIPLQYEDLFITNSKGQKIHAWYFHSQGVSKGTFLFFHGNAENLTSHFISLSWLPAHGYSYLIFDYPGYDKSEGIPSPESTVDTGKDVLRWLAKNKEPGPLYIYGQSLGGNIALRVCLEMKNEIPLKAIIIDGSFASYKGVGRAVLAKSPLTWILQPLSYLVLSDRYAPQDIGQLSPIPLLVIHGEKDPVIPVSEGKKLYAKAKEPKRLWLLPKAYHGDSFFTEDGLYRQKLLDYLESLK
ncbi:MAG: alpha/beta hydrolase [Pseudobdellovibrionaceae bacterium]